MTSLSVDWCDVRIDRQTDRQAAAIEERAWAAGFGPPCICRCLRCPAAETERRDLTQWPAARPPLKLTIQLSGADGAAPRAWWRRYDDHVSSLSVRPSVPITVSEFHSVSRPTRGRADCSLAASAVPRVRYSLYNDRTDLLAQHGALARAGCGIIRLQTRIRRDSVNHRSLLVFRQGGETSKGRNDHGSNRPVAEKYTTVPNRLGAEMSGDRKVRKSPYSITIIWLPIFRRTVCGVITAHKLTQPSVTILWSASHCHDIACFQRGWQ